MREIKFRVLDKKKNRLIMPEEICRLHFNEGLCYCVLLWTDEMVMDFELIDFTGLKDKNSKEIYEGDILLNDGGKIDEVIFHQGCFCYKLGDRRYHIFDNTIGGVIGNIYENPELLLGNGGKRRN